MGVYVSERSDTMNVEITNTDQAAAWDGHEGDVWTEHADRYDRAGGRIWACFTGAQLIGPADRVLDVGCGAGRSTLEAARMASGGGATGIDLSTRMLELARKRCANEGLANAHFIRGDAQVFPFESGSYDVAMSCFGAMFFNDPASAFTNIGRGLRAGGTLALLAWRSLQENDWLMSLRDALAVGRELPLPPPDAPTPFSLAEPDRVRRILGSVGFDDVVLEAIDEPMYLGADAADALAFAKTMGIVEGLTDGLDADTKAQAMSNLAQLYQDSESTDGVLAGSAAWLITARRR